MAKEIPATVQRIIHETVEDNFMSGIRFFGIEDGGFIMLLMNTTNLYFRMR